MRWIPLTDEKQLDEILAASYHKDIAIFKHSTRCSVSLMAKKIFEQQWDLPEDELPAYYLDLLTYRSISHRIAGLFAVMHESPQLLLIRDGKAIYHASHSEIDFDEMVKAV
jgi:bacillithiol system protein YtxJ